MNDSRRSPITVTSYQAASTPAASTAATSRPAVSAPAARRQQPDPLPRPSLGTRVLGWALLGASIGLVSCQSLFNL